jgi:hypothetical protein
MEKTEEYELRVDQIWCESEFQFPLKTNVLIFTVFLNLIPCMTKQRVLMPSFLDFMDNFIDPGDLLLTGPFVVSTPISTPFLVLVFCCNKGRQIYINLIETNTFHGFHIQDWMRNYLPVQLCT